MRPVLLISLVLCLNASAQQKAKPQLTAEQVIEKSIEATGGREAIEKIRSTTAKGRMFIEPQEVHSTIEYYAKAPDRRLMITFMEGVGEVKQGFDGQVAWSEDPSRGVRELSGAELADAKRDAVFNPELRWRELFRKIELIGKGKVGERAAYVIRLTPKTSKPITRYYDAQNFLLIRQVLTRDTAQGPMKIVVDFSDFRDVGGVKAPFQIKQSMPMVEITITMAEMRNNVEIDDAVFAKPAEK